MSDPRIIPPEEARKLADRYAKFVNPYPSEQRVSDLAHTAAVLGEQRAKLLSMHAGRHYCLTEYDLVPGPQLFIDGEVCPTARALGLTE